MVGGRKEEAICINHHPASSVSANLFRKSDQLTVKDVKVRRRNLREVNLSRI